MTPGKLRAEIVADRSAWILEMAGYRNRMVHFYDEVTPRELHEICTDRLPDVEVVLAEILSWVNEHPERVEGHPSDP